MDLFILRHGIAEIRENSARGIDSQRALTTEGKKKIRRVAHGMRAIGLTFDLILTSPFHRAKQTAEIVAEVFKLEKIVVLADALAADGNPRKLIDQLKLASRKRKSILIVGHEPYLSRLISILISGDTNLRITLKKGGLCKLSLTAPQFGSCAAMEWLLTPRQLRLLN